MRCSSGTRLLSQYEVSLLAASGLLERRGGGGREAWRVDTPVQGWIEGRRHRQGLPRTRFIS